MALPIYVQGAWFLGAALFIFGLKGMSSPASARKGIVIAGYGMLIAIAATFLIPGLKNLALMAVALAVGGAAAWISGQKVKMTDMPQMVAIYNGMGGGAAALIAAVEFMHPGEMPTSFAVLGITGYRFLQGPLDPATWLDAAALRWGSGGTPHLPAYHERAASFGRRGDGACASLDRG